MRLPDMAVVQLVLAVVAAAATPDVHSRGVNLYVGDMSAMLGYVPSHEDPVEAERARVRGHLLFAYDLLAAVDTSSWPAPQRAARALNLARLRAYALAGEFPHNDDHADRYRPTFVDNAGTICAVGALFAADRGRAAAEHVAAADKYGFVAQLQDTELATWQQTSGLSVAELGIIQPTYSEPPTAGEKAWLPFGLLDRMALAPLRLSATTEMTSANHYDTAGLTLHAQASTTCDCHIGAYGTLPMAVYLGDTPSGVAMAPGPVRMDSRTALGTADIGIFGGTEKWTGESTIYRLGMLLPTASREQGRLFATARVGDQALELPRSMGVRISTSMLQRWRSIPSGWLWDDDTKNAVRADLGLDIAVEYSNAVHDRITHVIPRAGIGTMFARKYGTVSLDTALSLDPLVDFEPRLRWSAGITGRLARVDGRGIWFQPALTLASVRTPEGWAGTLMLDLAATGQPKRRYSDDG